MVIFNSYVKLHQGGNMRKLRAYNIVNDGEWLISYNSIIINDNINVNQN